MENNVTVEMYPNPATDFITVNLQSDGQNVVNIIATDALGRAILSEAHTESGSWNIDVIDWAKGPYLFTVTEQGNGEFLYQKKLIVN